MAYDEQVAERLRLGLARLDGIAEQRMFGGLCFMMGGNMLCGAHGSRYIFRVGKAAEAEALARPGASIFDITGRPMGGYVWVEADACRGEALDGWIDLAVRCVGDLPPKRNGGKPRPRR